MNTEYPHLRWRLGAILLIGVIGLAMVGFIVGIIDLEPPQGDSPAALHTPDAADAVADSSGVVPAANYSEMRQMETGPTSQWKPTLQPIPTVYDYQRCITCHDPHSLQVHPSEESKRRSLATRSSRRAFNGAPPTIPHAVEQTDDAACYACHGPGARIGDRVANRMSHRFLVHCLQCHATAPPQPFADLETSVANTFGGLPTPNAGDRAFAALPVIPHSTWMRENCLSCHGGIAGWPGLEVTHRWRTNCQQCHAVSAMFEQSVEADIFGSTLAGDRQQP